jgi:hypothetical protein
MSIRDRVFATCAVKNLSTNQVVVDEEALLTRLLLFDTVVIDSFDLQEIPALVRLFGVDGLRELLAAGAIRFHAFHIYCGYLERTAPGLPADQMRFSLDFSGGTPARTGFYEITNVKIATPREQYHQYLKVVDELPGLRTKQAKALKRALADRFVLIPDGYTERSTAQTHIDLDRDSGALRRAVAQRLTAQSGHMVVPNAIDISVRREGPIAVTVESNLATTFGLPELDVDVPRFGGQGFSRRPARPLTLLY